MPKTQENDWQGDWLSCQWTLPRTPPDSKKEADSKKEPDSKKEAEVVLFYGWNEGAPGFGTRATIKIYNDSKKPVVVRVSNIDGVTPSDPKNRDVTLPPKNHLVVTGGKISVLADTKEGGLSGKFSLVQAVERTLPRSSPR